MTLQSGSDGDGAATASDGLPTVGVQAEREITVEDATGGADAATAVVTVEATAAEPTAFTIVERFDPAVATVEIVDADGADLQGVRDAGDGLFASYGGREAVSLVYEIAFDPDSATVHAVEGRTSTTTSNGSVDEPTVGDAALSAGSTPCPDAAARRSVDGQTVCDVDGDGTYRDVTGDGAVTNADVTQFFRTQHASPWSDRADLFDFTGDDRVSQADVIDLFEYVVGR